jgi:hypothetical protein
MSSSARVASDDRIPLFRGRTIGPLVAPASVARSPRPFRGGSAFRNGCGWRAGRAGARAPMGSARPRPGLAPMFPPNKKMGGELVAAIVARRSDGLKAAVSAGSGHVV